MYIYEKSIVIPRFPSHDSPLCFFAETIKTHCAPHEMPIRFAIIATDQEHYYCELGVISDETRIIHASPSSIFSFKKRDFEHTKKFNAVLLVPTGIGAEIGGHAGDATPVARLLAAACDTLITHPNVVNASDINELPENALYVEGSVVSRLLMGTVGLQPTRSNRVILIMDKPVDQFFQDSAINAVSAARASFGLNCPSVVKMSAKMPMCAFFAASGRAVGRIDNFEHLRHLLEQHRSSYDAVALSTIIDIPSELSNTYWKSEEMINPWGGIEAMLTHAISFLFDIPSAHSPMMNLEEKSAEGGDEYKNFGVVDPRKSAEIISTAYLHCVLKGLHRSPRIIPNAPFHSHTELISVADISCLIIPDKCIGLPTLAALEQGIPVIAVRENKNLMKNDLRDLPFRSGNLFIVDNYLEAAGVMNALRVGVAVETTRRPLAATVVLEA